MNENELQLNKKIKRGRMINIILFFVFITFIGFVSFTIFKMNTEARHMLREGKNVLTGLTMLDIEYYGTGKSIYDPNKWNGLADGVNERLTEINGVEGTVILTSYRKTTREVRGFIYERDGYRVTYSIEKSGKIGESEKAEKTEKTLWKIDYIINYLNYEADSK